MSAISVLSSNIFSIPSLAALKTKQGQLRLNWRRAKLQRQTIAQITRELADCTDRQLADLGLSRSEIPAVACGMYGRE